MEFIKRLLGMGASKPFKIQDGKGKKRIGIVASDLKELKSKAISKLGIEQVNRIVLEDDGTDVSDDEYFKTLEPQTVLVVLKANENWEGYISYLKLASTKIIDNASIRKDTIERFQQLLFDPESPELALMMEFVAVAHSNIAAEHKVEDPDWFDGLINSHKTKTQAMRESARSRIRGYLWKTKEFTDRIVLSKDKRKKLAEIINKFQTQLKNDQYHANYFDRLASDGTTRLCNDKGWFSCQGPFDKTKCNSSHTINPYASKETRILFSTWNLDHRIEKSREILPQLVEAIQKCPNTKIVNWTYFYQLLFTVDNLKIVDIRCHRKDKHVNEVVDKRKIYISKRT